jgi:hypothetical protein
MDQIFLEHRFDIVQMVVVLYCGVVATEYMNLWPMHAASFEFLLDSLEVIQVFGYIKMPFHFIIPVVTS